ncbi:hypothetical protein ES703_71032 [subsurface metagenome]
MKTIVMCILAGTSEACIGENCPMFKRCWGHLED